MACGLAALTIGDSGCVLEPPLSFGPAMVSPRVRDGEISLKTNDSSIRGSRR
jgi:hypothetical protein